MIDFRSEDGVREAFKAVAGWQPPTEPGSHAADVLPFKDTRPRSRRRRVWFAGAAAALVVAMIAALAARDPDDRFAAADGQWTKMASSPLSARFAPVSLWTGDELIVWGGHDAAGEEYVDGASYDPATDTWRPIADFPFTYQRRVGVGVGQSGSSMTYGTPGAWYRGRALFVVASGDERWAWDVVAYDPIADSWELLDSARFDYGPNDALVLREGTATVQSPTGLIALNGQLYVFGWHSELYEHGWSTFDPPTRTWTPFTGIPGSGGLYGSLGATPGPRVVGERVVWLGDRPFDDGWPQGYAIDIHTGDVTTIEPPMQAMSVRIGDVANDGVVTGITINENLERFAARLNPSTGRWTELDAPPSGANDEDAYGRLVTAGSATMLIGGVEWNLTEGGLKATPSQLALDRASGRWHRLPDPPIDLSRTGHVTVWTGERLLVWGGATTADRDQNSVTVPLDDGAQYVP